MQKVSIIVPVYNTGKYLNDCIQSLVNQTYTSIEIILVNDGSGDNSLDIIKLWQAKDPRIVSLNQINQGVTKARYNGVKKATGNWILFVDSDDSLPCNAVEEMIKNSKGYDIVIGHIVLKGSLDEWNFERKNCVYTQEDWITNLLIEGSVHWGPVAKLFKKTLFNDFVLDIPRKITNGEDFIFNLRIAMNCEKIKITDSTVYFYNIHEGSAISNDPFLSLSYCVLFEKEVWKSIKNTRFLYRSMYFKRLLRVVLRRFKHIIKHKVTN